MVVNGMENGMEWNGNFGMEYGMEDFKNGMEDNLPYFHTNSILDFTLSIYRKIYTDSQYFCKGGRFCSLEQTPSERKSALVKIMPFRPRNRVKTKKKKKRLYRNVGLNAAGICGVYSC